MASLLKVPTCTFTINNILRQYVKWVFKDQTGNWETCPTINTLKRFVCSSSLSPYPLSTSYLARLLCCCCWGGGLGCVDYSNYPIILFTDYEKGQWERKAWKENNHNHIPPPPPPPLRTMYAGKHRTNNIHYLHETESLLNQGQMEEALLGSRNPC